ncbi:MAG: SUMF1/EgtB/PvdO family nonheme iron enzyme, partial [Cyanobacteria bacterium P01_D01_bin.116]
MMLRQNLQEAVLIDFGLAREFNLNQTGSMTNSRTEGYAPIEQYERRGKFGTYTDVYALAATLYALVTGETPLPANFRQTGIPLPLPKQRNPDISDKVNDGIIKGMGLEPQDRPQRVREWLDLLISTQAQSPVIQNKSTLPATVLSLKPANTTQVSQIPPQKPSKPKKALQINQNNTIGKIQTRKFEFEYAQIGKIEVNKGFLGVGRKVHIDIKDYPKEAEGFTEDLGNGVTLEMVLIPSGSFMMGAPEDEKESRDSERPQHKVNIQPFFMGKYQVTQEQYQAIMGKNPSRFQGKKQPVEKVSWNNAVEFCTKLSELTGKEYRLPSEAEWEYACRAGTTTPFHFGETITTDLANYNGDYIYGAAPKGKYRQETTDVGTFRANSFGLYDMHGNVWEWCLDDWHNSYDGAPTDGSVWVNHHNENDNPFRVLRGGSWANYPDNCRSASRY